MGSRPAWVSVQPIMAEATEAERPPTTARLIDCCIMRHEPLPDRRLINAPARQRAATDDRGRLRDDRRGIVPPAESGRDESGPPIASAAPRQGGSGGFRPGHPHATLHEHLGQAGHATSRNPYQMRMTRRRDFRRGCFPSATDPSASRPGPSSDSTSGKRPTWAASTSAPKPYYRFDRQNARNVSTTGATNHRNYVSCPSQRRQGNEPSATIPIPTSHLPFRNPPIIFENGWIHSSHGSTLSMSRGRALRPIPSFDPHGILILRSSSLLSPLMIRGDSSTWRPMPPPASMPSD